MNCIGHVDAFPSTEHHFGGLTKREYFAAMAMQALMTSHSGGYAVRATADARRYAADAVLAADALIEELNK